MKYGYNFDKFGAYDCGYDSVKAAIEGAREEAEVNEEDGLFEKGNVVYVGKVVTCRPTLDVDSLIEMMQDNMNERTDGFSTDNGYLDYLSPAKKEKLDRILRDAIVRWGEEAKVFVTVDIVVDIKKYDLLTGKRIFE